VGAVERALSNPARHAQVRAEIAGDLFYHPGGATAAAVSWLEGQLVTSAERLARIAAPKHQHK